MTRILFAMFWMVLMGCSTINVENPTDKFLAGQKLSKLRSDQLGEISGGVASINNPGLFWLHNDSGNEPELYLVDDSLKVLFTCSLDVENRDWEDMAIGPGPVAGRTYIYLGEIGDNLSKYDKKHIFRFEEPVWDRHSRDLDITDVDTISFTLEGKNKDTETLLLDPSSKDIYIISKRDEPVWVYRLKFPYSADSTLVAAKLFSLPFTQIVSGDISPDGKKILLKNYEHVYFWENIKGLAVTEALKQKPFEIPYEIEPQGETIMWGRDGSGFYTVSEKNVGKSSYLYLYKQKEPLQ
jgi:hypothetical protein